MDLSFKGMLFDLDGTLVDSFQAVTDAWVAFAQKYKLNATEVLASIQGRPAYESIRSLRPDASEADICKDAKWLESIEARDTDGVVALPGAQQMLQTLNNRGFPWAIVTSGTLPVATARIAAANLPCPKILVTPELLSKGKPDPEPYLLGAKKIALQASDCIVFEDAPAGVASGAAAGATVVGVLSQADQSALLAQNATVCVSSLLQVRLSFHGDEAVMKIS